jgi:hypothetical protein
LKGKFKKGDIVYERINPHRKLVVGQLRDGLYYCRLPENKRRLFVYQERELKSADDGQHSTVPIL